MNYNKNTQLNQTDVGRLAAIQAGIGFMLWDVASDTCHECSDIARQLFELPPVAQAKSFPADALRQRIVEEDRSRLPVNMTPAFNIGERYELTYRLITRDKTSRWLHETGEPVRDDENTANIYLITVRDVTNDVSERRLLERERFFVRQVEHVIGAGVFVWDVESQRNIYTSDSLAYMHGMTQEEMVAAIDGEEADIELAHPDDQAHVAEAYERSRLYGDPIDVEYRFEHPTNGLRWFHEVAVRRTLGDDARVVTMGMLHDITDLKRTENVVEVHRRLAIEAEKASRAKSEFLASMSHELRTPLNAILGFAQMLQHIPDISLRERELEYIDYIIGGGNHLLDLINQILDLARIEAGQLDLAIENVDANKIVADCVAMTKPLGAGREIEIHDHFSGTGSKPIMVDPLRFKQIVFNLLSNAVKYNHDHGSVTVECQACDADRIRLAVTDTGIGIAKSDQANIFEMFHRTEAAPTISKEGAGIGLYVSRILVEKMSGRIGFDTVEGEGTTFWIELPQATT